MTLEIEGIDRMYLNVYVPQLQRESGVASFFRFHRGHPFASSVLMDPISKAFVDGMERFAKQQKVPVVLFGKGERKDDIAAGHLSKFQGEEGVLFIGRAQKKTPVIRTERRRNEQTGATYPWLVRSTAMVNHFCVYCVDRDFGPFFLKFSTYFPYNAKLCLNGHEYVKRQLDPKGKQEVRALLAQLLGHDPANYPVGRMTYDLRRLRLHGIILRIPKSHRYQLTPSGLRIALFFSRTYARLLRPHLAQVAHGATRELSTPGRFRPTTEGDRPMLRRPKTRRLKT